jgi:hypothetical protein
LSGSVTLSIVHPDAGIRKIAVGSNGDNQPPLPDISFPGIFLLLILGAG